MLASYLTPTPLKDKFNQGNGNPHDWKSIKTPNPNIPTSLKNKFNQGNRETHMARKVSRHLIQMFQIPSQLAP